MSRKINPKRPLGLGHDKSPGAGNANARLSTVAAFRALLGIKPPPQGIAKDRKTLRRESGRAGGIVRTGRGGSHLDAELDDALDGVSSREGDGERSPRRNFLTAVEGVDAPSFASIIDEAVSPSGGGRTISSDEAVPLPPVWQAIPLPGSWKRADPPLAPYGPPIAREQALRVPSSVQRWWRPPSIRPYTSSLVPIPAPSGKSRFRSFVSPQVRAAGAEESLSLGLGIRARSSAASFRAFEPSDTPAGMLERRLGYREFDPESLPAADVVPSATRPVSRHREFIAPSAPSASAGAATPLRLALGIRVTASTQRYDRPIPASLEQIVEPVRRTFAPPPALGSETGAPKIEAGGSRRPVTSIDTLLAGLKGPKRPIAAEFVSLAD